MQLQEKMQHKIMAIRHGQKYEDKKAQKIIQFKTSPPPPPIIYCSTATKILNFEFFITKNESKLCRHHSKLCRLHGNGSNKQVSDREITLTNGNQFKPSGFVETKWKTIYNKAVVANLPPFAIKC